MTTYFRNLSIAVIVTLTAVFSVNSCRAAGTVKGVYLDRIHLPPGFEISLFDENVPNARSMVLSPGGVLFVGTRREGKVYAVLDKNRDNHADAVLVIAEDLYMSNGVAFRDGSLFVAEINRILRFDHIESRLSDPPEPVVVSKKSPIIAITRQMP